MARAFLYGDERYGFGQIFGWVGFPFGWDMSTVLNVLFGDNPPLGVCSCHGY
jgi:hypothetical protein